MYLRCRRVDVHGTFRAGLHRATVNGPLTANPGVVSTAALARSAYLRPLGNPVGGAHRVQPVLGADGSETTLCRSRHRGWIHSRDADIRGAHRRACPQRRAIFVQEPHATLACRPRHRHDRHGQADDPTTSPQDALRPDGSAHHVPVEDGQRNRPARR